MNLKKKCAAALLAGLVACSSAYAATADRETIQQVALLQSLAQGYFGGTVTVKQLRSVGDTVDTTDGSTDIPVIAPAITELVKKGIEAFGPINAATFFDTQNYKAYDAVLQIYGTQCTAAYRALGTEPVISLIGGTETPVASAEADGMYRALWAVMDMRRNRVEYDKPFANPLEKLYHERREDGEKARFAIKKKGFNPAEHRRENVKFVTRNTPQQEQETPEETEK